MTPIDLKPAHIPQDLEEIVQILADVACTLSDEISLGSLEADYSALVGENAGGDGQKALDLVADEAFMSALAQTALRYYASEEQVKVATLNPKGAYGLAIDPLDGSSNIDANVSIGTIFSLVKAQNSIEATFTGDVNAQLVAGYFIYGPQTALVISAGLGTHQFIYDRRQDIYRYAGEMSVPKTTKEFAINASNHRHWPEPIRSYVDICLSGEDGPRARNFNMRWIASLVAETHRILSRGGVFIYTSDDRAGYEHGRLRILYECTPIAFLVQNAGGAASNGTENYTHVRAKDIHARTGFVFGAKEEVEYIERLNQLPISERSPLFRQRGLFSQ